MADGVRAWLRKLGLEEYHATFEIEDFCSFDDLCFLKSPEAFKLLVDKCNARFPYGHLTKAKWVGMLQIAVSKLGAHEMFEVPSEDDEAMEVVKNPKAQTKPNRRMAPQHSEPRKTPQARAVKSIPSDDDEISPIFSRNRKRGSGGATAAAEVDDPLPLDTVPRKRGRPRKAPAVIEDSGDMPNTAAAAEVDDPLALNKAPRKRGRPRKAIEATGDKLNTAAATEVDENLALDKVPRKKGRPRKQEAPPSIVDSELSAMESDTESLALDTVPKKRGRPRKGALDSAIKNNKPTPASVKSLDVDSLSKKRGRPKKTAVGAATAQGSSAAPAAAAAAARTAGASDSNLQAMLTKALRAKPGSDTVIKLKPGTYDYTNTGSGEWIELRDLSKLTISAPRGATIRLKGKTGLYWNGTCLNMQGGEAAGEQLVLVHEKAVTKGAAGCTIAIRQGGTFKNVRFVGVRQESHNQNVLVDFRDDLVIGSEVVFDECSFVGAENCVQLRNPFFGGEWPQVKEYAVRMTNCRIEDVFGCGIIAESGVRLFVNDLLCDRIGIDSIWLIKNSEAVLEDVTCRRFNLKDFHDVICKGTAVHDACAGPSTITRLTLDFDGVPAKSIGLTVDIPTDVPGPFKRNVEALTILQPYEKGMITVEGPVEKLELNGSHKVWTTEELVREIRSC